MSDTRRICAILLDTKGPEIRTGKLREIGQVQLIKNQDFILTTDESVLGDAQKVAVGYSSLPKLVKPGQHVLIDDGLIDLLVLETSSTEVRCRVLNNGALGPSRGVNLPGVSIDLPAVTQKDVADLKFGVEMGVDFIAASFVRKAADVITIRRILGPKGAHIKIIAKIESQEGLENFHSIAAVSDGIMVARGDLGVEIPIEQVALAQKQMIKHCNMVSHHNTTPTQLDSSRTPELTLDRGTSDTSTLFTQTYAFSLFFCHLFFLVPPFRLVNSSSPLPRCSKVCVSILHPPVPKRVMLQMPCWMVPIV